VALVARDGTILRDATAAPAIWRDPDDDRDPNTARGRAPAVVRGWRRTWTIDRMHATDATHVTSRHVNAATRFLDDHELREGVRPGRRTVERVDHTGDGEPIINRAILAGIRVERAREAVGPAAYALLFRIVILNYPVARLTTWLSCNAHAATGRVHAALDRLVEHYDSR
jgi:Domain of unknown function (DUF6456)